MTSFLAPLRAAFVLSIFLCATGCSILTVARVPSDYARLESLECSSRETAPVTDLVFAGIGAGLLAIALAPPPEDAEAPPESLGAVGAVTALTFGLSAAYGFTETKRCRHALRQHSPRVGRAP